MPEATPPSSPPSLDALRRRIDEIDGELHALLKARAEVVTEVARAKAADASGAPSPAFRPGREAEVLRQLVARHDGPLALPSLVRIWREIISGMTRMQQEVTVAVCRPEKGCGAGWDAARDHFGLGMRYLALRRPADVIAAVRDGRAGIGVAPAPATAGGSDEDGEEPWWPLLAKDDSTQPRIVLKLPFLRPAGLAGPGQVALTLPGPEPEQVDVHYLAVHAAPGADRAAVAKALAAAGLNAGPLAAAPSEGLYLAEATGPWPAAVDTAAVRYITAIGGYPTPIALA